MNVLLSPQPSHFPHHRDASRHSPTRSFNPYPSNMSARKRKADDELDRPEHHGGHFDDSMSVSPTNSPATSSRLLARPSKRLRNNEITGRPLALPRLLETLDADSLRNVLQTICERHPQIGNEVVTSAPRPTVQCALAVLAKYQDQLREAFPFGGNTTSDYAYNRVKKELNALIEALIDFTPQYLPPNEQQATVSLNFLDGATKFVHALPEWDNRSHKHHKDDAYDELSRAWALVIQEASKKGGGIQLQYGGWDQKLAKHNEQAGGRMQAAVNALGGNLGWMGNGGGFGASSAEQGSSSSIRDQLFSGTYGSNLPVRVGPF